MLRISLLLIVTLTVNLLVAQKSGSYLRVSTKIGGGEIIKSGIGLDDGKYAVLKQKGFSFSVLILDENLKEYSLAYVKRLHPSGSLKNIGLIYFGKRLYVHYSHYDSKSKGDNFYVREIDIKAGVFMETQSIVRFPTTKGRIGIFKWGFSPDGTKIWIAYEPKSVKTSSQMLMISTLNHELITIQNIREVLVNKTPVFKPLDYFVDNAGNAYCAGFEYRDYNTMNNTYVTNLYEYTTILYSFTKAKKEPIKAELKLPNNLISIVKIALNEDVIYLVGYSSEHNNISIGAAFSAKFNAQGGYFENVTEYKIPQKVIMENDDVALVGRNVKNRSEKAPGIYKYELGYVAVIDSRIVMIGQEVERVNVDYMSGSPSKYYHIDELHGTLYGNIIVTVLNESSKSIYVSIVKTWDKEKSHVLRPSPYHIDYHNEGIDIYYLQEYRLFRSSLNGEGFSKGEVVFEGDHFDKWKIQSMELRSDLMKGALIYRKKSSKVDFVRTW